MRIIILYATFLLCLSQTFATHSIAREMLMRHYAEEDGLPGGPVFGILNDSKGFLWFATDAGVSRFDGHRFTNFTLSDGLSENTILKIAEDSKGRIWLLGLSGTLCYYYNGKFFGAFNDTVLKKARINNSYIFFFEDKRHRLWFSSYTGYTIIDKDSVTLLHNEREQEQTQGEGIVMNNNRGGVNILAPFISTETRIHGLYVFEGSKRTRHAMAYNKQYRSRFCYLPDGTVLFISPDGIVLQKDTMQQLILATRRTIRNTSTLGVTLSSDNKLWVQTLDSGVYCYNYNDLSATPERHLRNTGIADVIEDNEHNIWVSTFSDGVYMLPRDNRSVHNYYYSNTKNNIVYCVTKDRQGNIYTGHDEMTLNILRNGAITTMRPEVGKGPYMSKRINKVLIHDNEIWIGSDKQLTHFTKDGIDPKGKEVMLVTGPIHSKQTYVPVRVVKDIAWFKNDVLVCSYISVLRRDTIDAANEILTPINADFKRKYCVYADKAGTVWYGASDGLYSYDLNRELNHASESIYMSGSIYDIDETADSVLILATYGNGILLYKDKKVLQHLTEADGLSSNLCRKIFVHNNIIYVATTGGVTLINYSNRHMVVAKKITTANGILANNVNDVYADDSELCIATTGGLSTFNTRLPEIVPVAPPVVITGITCKGRKLATDSNYEFCYDQNKLQFSYTGICYKLPGDVVYQYRLSDGVVWQETRNTSLDFPFLPPGSYHFQVRARILNGPWSTPRSFYFTINPPFWKTVWFQALCFDLFILLVVFLIRYLIKRAGRKQQAQLKIKDQVAHLEQQALQAMMNPHFIFNVMNSIQHYINNNEKHEANIYLSKFASLIRTNLDISSKRYIPLDDEIAYLELYLSLETLRFGKRLTYKIDIDPAIDGDETMMPVMLLQPFIENAIWHGILPKNGDGHVQLDIIKEKNGMLLIRVTDNGTGIATDKQTGGSGIQAHTSKGMKMTHQRLDLIGQITGHQLHIQISDAFPGEIYKGTCIEMLLPGDLS